MSHPRAKWFCTSSENSVARNTLALKPSRETTFPLKDKASPSHSPNPDAAGANETIPKDVKVLSDSGQPAWRLLKFLPLSDPISVELGDISA